MHFETQWYVISKYELASVNDPCLLFFRLNQICLLPAPILGVHTPELLMTSPSKKYYVFFIWDNKEIHQWLLVISIAISEWKRKGCLLWIVDSFLLDFVNRNPFTSIFLVIKSSSSFEMKEGIKWKRGKTSLSSRKKK